MGILNAIPKAGRRIADALGSGARTTGRTAKQYPKTSAAIGAGGAYAVTAGNDGSDNGGGVFGDLANPFKPVQQAFAGLSDLAMAGIAAVVVIILGWRGLPLLKESL